MYKYISILFLILLISCSTTGRKAGSLSDAMDKTSDDYQGERKVEAEAEEEDMPEPECEENFIVFTDSVHQKKAEQRFFKDLWLGVQFGTGIMSTESFYGISTFSFTGNQFYGDRKAVGFEIGAGYSPLQTTQTAEFDPAEDEIVQALDGGIFTLNCGIDFKYYLTPKKTFLGNYYSAGLKLQSMFWSYKNQLQIDEYDEQDNYSGTVSIKNDQLWGLDINCAAAFNYIQLKHLILGIEFNPGIIIWGPETYQGFTNDVFLPFLYFKTNFNFMLK